MITWNWKWLPADFGLGAGVEPADGHEAAAAAPLQLGFLQRRCRPAATGHHPAPARHHQQVSVSSARWTFTATHLNEGVTEWGSKWVNFTSVSRRLATKGEECRVVVLRFIFAFFFFVSF